MHFKSVLILIWLPLSLFARTGYIAPWGKDVELSVKRTQNQEASRSIAVKCAEVVIAFHQNVLSPVDGPRSHFYPSSSNYMLDAIYSYGFMKGFVMGCDRLLRENDDPWIYPTIECQGGLMKYDPVP